MNLKPIQTLATAILLSAAPATSLLADSTVNPALNPEGTLSEIVTNMTRERQEELLSVCGFSPAQITTMRCALDKNRLNHLNENEIIKFTEEFKLLLSSYSYNSTVIQDYAASLLEFHKSVGAENLPENITINALNVVGATFDPSDTTLATADTHLEKEGINLEINGIEYTEIATPNSDGTPILEMIKGQETESLPSFLGKYLDTGGLSVKKGNVEPQPDGKIRLTMSLPMINILKQNNVKGNIQDAYIQIDPESGAQHFIIQNGGTQQVVNLIKVHSLEFIPATKALGLWQKQEVKKQKGKKQAKAENPAPVDVQEELAHTIETVSTEQFETRYNTEASDEITQRFADQSQITSSFLFNDTKTNTQKITAILNQLFREETDANFIQWVLENKLHDLEGMILAEISTRKDFALEQLEGEYKGLNKDIQNTLAEAYTKLPNVKWENLSDNDVRVMNKYIGQVLDLVTSAFGITIDQVNKTVNLDGVILTQKDIERRVKEMIALEQKAQKNALTASAGYVPNPNNGQNTDQTREGTKVGRMATPEQSGNSNIMNGESIWEMIKANPKLSGLGGSIGLLLLLMYLFRSGKLHNLREVKRTKKLQEKSPHQPVADQKKKRAGNPFQRGNRRSAPSSSDNVVHILQPSPETNPFNAFDEEVA